MEYSKKPGKYYVDSRPEMQALLPNKAKKILDVGCGQGAMSAELKKQHQIEAWGIEFMEDEAKMAKERLDNVINLKLEDAIDLLPDNYFDAIYLNDVLEHLAYPEDSLKKIKTKLSDNGVIISSIPNIRSHKVITRFIFQGDWKYQKSGVMDYTHLRFFTSKSIKRMYENNGFEIVEHFGINKSKSLMPYVYNILLFCTALDCFYPQFATIAKKSA